MTSNRPSVVLHGAAVGLETLAGLRFLPHRPYTGCCICGEIFQSELDRFPAQAFEQNPVRFDFKPNNVFMEAMTLRRQWAESHAKTHSEKEHLALQASGNWCTPEAAKRLASYGTISVADGVISKEHEQALAESSAIPVNDVEGT